MGIQDITLEVVGGSTAGVLGLWALISKVLLRTSKDNTGRAAATAEESVIELLQKEVHRMAESNKALGEELARQQIVAAQQWQDQNNKIMEQALTINKLTARVNQLDRRRAECEGCPHNLHYN